MSLRIQSLSALLYVSILWSRSACTNLILCPQYSTEKNTDSATAMQDLPTRRGQFSNHHWLGLFLFFSVCFYSVCCLPPVTKVTMRCRMWLHSIFTHKSTSTDDVANCCQYCLNLEVMNRGMTPTSQIQWLGLAWCPALSQEGRAWQ